MRFTEMFLAIHALLAIAASAAPTSCLNSVKRCQLFESRPQTSADKRSWIDLATSAAGAATSIAFLGVTGQYYYKTFGKRSSKGGCRLPLVQDQIMTSTCSDTSPSSDIAARGPDTYPAVLGSLMVLLSAAGLTANIIAHHRLEAIDAHKPTHKLLTQRSELKHRSPGWVTEAKREQVEMLSKAAPLRATSDTVAKTLELLATSVSFLSVPFMFANVFAIGKQPPKSTTKERGM
ncbi:hypothetical protein V8E36_005721 [Tilletia maclaganii]